MSGHPALYYFQVFYIFYSGRVARILGTPRYCWRRTGDVIMLFFGLQRTGFPRFVLVVPPAAVRPGQCAWYFGTGCALLVFYLRLRFPCLRSYFGCLQSSVAFNYLLFESANKFLVFFPSSRRGSTGWVSSILIISTSDESSPL